MGPSSASSNHALLVSPSSSSASPPISLPDWFLTDRDTQILTQALTHELSTPAAPSPSSSPPRCQTLSNASCDQRFDQSESLHVLRALQQQQHKQQHQQQWPVSAAAMTALQQHLQQRQAATMGRSCGGGWRGQDAFHHVEHNSLHMGSPASSNSHSPTTPGSPHSNLSTITTTNSSMSIPMDSLLADINANTSLHRDVHVGVFAGSMISHNASAQAEVFNVNSSCCHSSRGASMALSSQAAQGGGSTKISKRRSRATIRNPITVLSADVSNFRAMVQQLTGIPSAQSMQSYGNSSLLKPHPIKHPYTNTESLPTLDTSASFLGPKPTTKDPLEGFSFAQGNHQLFSGSLSGVGNSGFQGFNADSMLRSSAPHNAKQSVFGDQPSLSSSLSTLSSMWNYASNAKPKGNSDTPLIESHHFATKQAAVASEEHQLIKSQYNAEDSWLSFDGLFANEAPDIEIARMA